MLSPFTAVPVAAPTPAKSTAHLGSPKAEAGAPADHTPFHELLARKTPEAAPKPRAETKAEAKDAHQDAGADDSSHANKPADCSINRRLTKPAAKPATKADNTASGNEPVDTTPLDEATTAADAQPAADTATQEVPVDTATAEDPALAALSLLPGLPLNPALPPAAPLAPLTLGLPTAGTPSNAESADATGTTEAAAALLPTDGRQRMTAAKFAADSTTAAVSAGVVAPQGRLRQPAAAPFGVAGSAPLQGNATESTTPDTTTASAPDAVASATPATATATVGSQSATRQASGVYSQSAQIAEAAVQARPEGKNLTGDKNNNTVQDADFKGYKKQESADGIRPAYEQPSMTATAPIFTAPTHSVQTLAPVVSSVAPSVASTAVRMVEKVSEVADHLAAHPSEQVTVRIDLDETHRVDVHVSMRGGQVHADFRSDSPDMRAALASAWNSFSQGREGSNRNWAEPAFAPMAAPAKADSASSFSASLQSSDSSSSFGPGQDSAKRQASERDATPLWSGSPTRPAGSAPASTEIKPAAGRSDNSQHLSVLA